VAEEQGELLKKGIILAAVALTAALALPPLLTFIVSTAGFASAGLGAATAVAAIGSGLIAGGVALAGPRMLKSLSPNSESTVAATSSRTSSTLPDVNAPDTSEISIQMGAQPAYPVSFRQRVDEGRQGPKTTDRQL
jgi:hypothetical protein